ncbi:hypothetical protein GYH30_025896 [Glycine max]|nr:hypothetical protein GYH30_025896 [Glycine max]
MKILVGVTLFGEFLKELEWELLFLFSLDLKKERGGHNNVLVVEN